jgi:hypothetical protein
VVDFKLIAKPEEELQKRIQTVKIFCDGNNMEFGLAKCAKFAFRGCKLVESQNLVIEVSREIQVVEQGIT